MRTWRAWLTWPTPGTPRHIVSSPPGWMRKFARLAMGEAEARRGRTAKSVAERKETIMIDLLDVALAGRAVVRLLRLMVDYEG